MRCLYCGNELPVFKKLTGGGEFCSEAHRQSYQEEYNRLALSRLLQAQTPDDRSKSAKRAATDTLAPSVPEPAYVESRPSNGAAAQAKAETNGSHTAIPVREKSLPPTTRNKVAEPDAVAPAEPADFLWEVPDPIWWESADLRASDAVFCEPDRAVQPAGVALLQLDAVEEAEGDLAMADSLSLAELRRASAPRDYKSRPRETRLDLREFGRVEPLVTVELGTSGTARLTSAATARDFEIAAIPPAGGGGNQFWHAGEHPFPEGSAEIEFSNWVALEFPTTGIEVPSDDGGETQIVQIPAPEVLSRLDVANKAASPDQDVDLRSFLPAAKVDEPVVSEPAVSAPVPLEIAVEEKPVIEAQVEEPLAVVAQLKPKTEKAEPEIEEIGTVHAIAVEEPAMAEEASVEEAVVEEVHAEKVEEEAVVEAATEALVVIEPAPEVLEAPVAPSEPRRATTPLPVNPRAIAPGASAAQAPVSWVPVTSFGMHLPRVTAVPMRLAMTFGPAPQPENVEVPKEAQVQATAPAEPATDAPKVEAPKPEGPKVDAPAAQTAQDRRTRDTRNAGRNLKIRNRGGQVSAPQARPEAQPPAVPANAAPAMEPPKAPPAIPAPTIPAPAPPPIAQATVAPTLVQPVKDAKEATPKETPAPKEPMKAPALKAAAPVVTPKLEPKTEPKSEPKPEPKVDPKPAAKIEPKPEPRPELKAETQKADIPLGRSFGGDAPHLGGQPVGFIEGLPAVVKIGAVVAVLAILGFVAYLNLGGGGGKSTGKDSGVEVAGPGMLIGEGGWSPDFTGEAAGVKRNRQISIYRPSMQLSDYRIELQGQIEAKSMGVVYRANNPQNYYVVKLEVLKPGLNPQVALVRWAVINGEDGPRAQIPLPMPVRIDTLYKLRLDVRGNTTTTYVLDQKVDQWNDDRIHSGGVGLINERGDRSSIKAVMVTPLVVKNK